MRCGDGDAQVARAIVERLFQKVPLIDWGYNFVDSDRLGYYELKITGAICIRNRYGGLRMINGECLVRSEIMEQLPGESIDRAIANIVVGCLSKSFLSHWHSADTP